MNCATIIDLGLDQLRLAPERFQFKSGANAETGAGLALADVTVFDIGMSGIITAWLSPEGHFFVINGHHRVELARTLQWTRELRAQVLDSASSFPGAIRCHVDEQAARTYGALINISEGRGDALDAAKLMRDNAMSEQEMSSRGISLTDKLMAQAVPLSHLDDSLFYAAIYGRIEVSTAVIIGRELPDDPEAQREIFRLTQQDDRNPHRTNYLTDSRLLELVRLGKSAGTVQTQDSLFSGESMRQSLLPQKAELLEHAKRNLRSNVHVFGSAVRHSRLLETGGTVVDRETGQRISGSSAASLEVLNRTAYCAGTAASDALNRYAAQLAKVAHTAYAMRREIAADCFAAIAEVVGREAESLTTVSMEAA